MLLAIDLGNSTIGCALFEKSELTRHWLLSADRSNAKAFDALFKSRLRGAGAQPEQITDVIVSSVVPPLTPVIEAIIERLLHRRCLVVSSDMHSGLTLAYTNPMELGTDRLAAAAAAYDRHKTALIVVDIGTATTFNAVTHTGEYLGGVIAPGIRMGADSLAAGTAQLPRVDLARPKTVIGRDTSSSIQSGLIFGHAGLIDDTVTRMQQEMGRKTLVLATGGLASLIAPESRTITEVRPFLTLEGLELLHRLTRGNG